VLKAVREQLKSGKAYPTVPPGNLAYRRQSSLLSLDGSHELEVNGGVHFPRLGVDGNPQTTALAGGQWPWTYEVDLVDTVPVRRMKITFGTGYATEFEFRLSEDRKTWKTVAARADHDGSPFEAEFEPVRARYVRVCALKPDGPGQKGSQMSVAELEVYR